MPQLFPSTSGKLGISPELRDGWFYKLYDANRKVQVHCIDTGYGSNIRGTIVLYLGMGGSVASSQFVVRVLKEIGFRVIMIDSRDTGHSIYRSSLDRNGGEPNKRCNEPDSSTTTIQNRNYHPVIGFERSLLGSQSPFHAFPNQQNRPPIYEKNLGWNPLLSRFMVPIPLNSNHLTQKEQLELCKDVEFANSMSTSNMEKRCREQHQQLRTKSALEQKRENQKEGALASRALSQIVTTIATSFQKEPLYSVVDLVDDLKFAIDQRLGARSCNEPFRNGEYHLIGISLGGMVAQEFAIRYPEYLKTLTLISSPCHVQGSSELGEMPAIEKIIDLIRLSFTNAENKGKVYVETMRKSMRNDVSDEEVHQRAKSMVTTQSDEHANGTYLRQIASIVNGTQSPTLISKQIPVSIIHGSDDDVVHLSHAHKLHEMIPNSKLTILKGEKHTSSHAIVYKLISDIMVPFYLSV